MVPHSYDFAVSSGACFRVSAICLRSSQKRQGEKERLAKSLLEARQRYVLNAKVLDLLEDLANGVSSIWYYDCI